MNYKHECIEWDGMEIDILCTEIACCSCYDDDLFRTIKHIHNRYHFQIQELLGIFEVIKKNSINLGNG